MTTPIPSLFDRLTGCAVVDNESYQQGADAALTTGNESDNPYPKRTLQHWSWAKGFKTYDDSCYVW